mgnify:CR=1 FL=1|jgi:hypothetical protein
MTYQDANTIVDDISRCSLVEQGAAFGLQRSQVQILSSRPL